MRYQFSLANLLTLITIVSFGLGLIPLAQYSSVASGIGGSLLVGSLCGGVVGFLYGQVRQTVLWSMISCLLVALGWLMITYRTWPSEPHSSFTISFLLIALPVAVSSASVAAVFHRRHAELLIRPCFNCFLALTLCELLGLALLVFGAALAWIYGQPWQGHIIPNLVKYLPRVLVISLIVSVISGVTFGSLGIAIKGLIYLEALGRETRKTMP